MIVIFHILLLLLAVLQSAQAAFIAGQTCQVDTSKLTLQPFVIDAALDEQNKVLKFFINSMVIMQDYNGTDRRNTSDPAYVELFNPVITDVDPATNRYTTFHIEIDFMGKTFINENRRFCDMAVVKDTLAYQDGPRFNPPTPPENTTSTHHPPFTSPPSNTTTSKNKMSKIHRRHHHELSKRMYFDPDVYEFEDGEGNFILPDPPPGPINLASSNASIEYIFNNMSTALAHCPLFDGDSIAMYYEADISQHFHRLGSYTVRFSVISNEPASDVIGCSLMYVTPVQPEWLSTALVLGIVILLMVTGVVNSFTIIFSSYQESSNPCLFLASTICNEDLLKQLDATVPRIILYLQFALFIGGLDLQYPGFYQPLIGSIRWCSLLGYNLVKNLASEKHVKSDNIYRTFNLGGLRNLTIISTDISDHVTWVNFILCFLIFLAGQMISIQLLLWFKIVLDILVKRYNNFRNKTKSTLLNDDLSDFDFTAKRNFYYLLGYALDSFLVLFSLPFLVLTSSMFFNAANENRKPFAPNMASLEADAFSVVSPYGTMFAPFAIYSSLRNNDTLPKINGNYYNLTDITGESSNSTSILVFNPYSTFSPGVVTCGALLFTFWIGLVLFFVFNYLVSIKAWKVTASKKITRLYTSIRTVMVWGFIYQTYHPTRLYFIVSMFLSLVCKSLIIGCLQSNGLFQVAILIILEFLDVAALFIIRPTYVGLGRISSVWILPVARFMVTVLCIPYIRELGLSESIRTYVAFAQFIIHVVVALVFAIQLIYCLITTIVSIIKMNNEKKQYEQYSFKDVKSTSSDDFVKDFEYKPVQPPISPVNPTPMQDLSVGDEIFKQFAYEQRVPAPTIMNILAEHEEEEVEEDFYYRSKSQKRLQKISMCPSSPRSSSSPSRPRSVSPVNEPEKEDLPTVPDYGTVDEKVEHSSDLGGIFTSDQYSIRSESDLQSFTRLQYYSNLRKQQNDYRVREGDQIYKKYFVDDSIDPEMKALWDSRHNRINTGNYGNYSIPPATGHHNKMQTKVQNTSYDEPREESSNSMITRVGSFFSGFVAKKEVPEKGFQVSRPRQLIVKTLAEIDTGKRSMEDSPESESPISKASWEYSTSDSSQKVL